MDDPNGKVALVTGAGLGRAALVQLAGAGARVVAVGRTEATLVIPELRKRGGGAIVNVASVGGTRGMADAPTYCNGSVLAMDGGSSA